MPSQSTGDVRLLTFAPEHFVAPLDDPDNRYHAAIAEAATALQVPSAGDRRKAAEHWIGQLGIGQLAWPAADLERLAVVCLMRAAAVSRNRQILGEMAFFEAAASLDYLLAALLDQRIAWSRRSVIALLQHVNACSVYCPARRVFAIARECCDTHGFDAELLAAFRSFEKGTHGSLSAQDLRAQVALFLLRDPITPPDLKRCWSETVRASFRDMDPGERARWHKLLDTVSPTQVRKPSKSWLKLARGPYEALGSDFETRIEEWFAPFSGSTPLNLSTEGSHLLRHLLWYCSLSPRTRSYAARIAGAPWKQTRKLQSAVAKVATTAAWLLEQLPPAEAIPHLQALEQAFGAGGTRIQESLSRADQGAPIAAKPGPDPLAGIDVDKIRDMVAKRFRQTLPGAERLTQHGDDYIVAGDLDRYRLRDDSPFVTRLSDGATAELDYSRLLALGVFLPPGARPTLWMRSLLLTQDEPHQFQRFER